MRILYSAPNVSWIDDALRVLEENLELILVSPAFPGLSSRKLRQRPTTRPMPKLNGSPLRGPVEAEDMTCQHPYTLPGASKGLLLSGISLLRLGLGAFRGLWGFWSPIGLAWRSGDPVGYRALSESAAAQQREGASLRRPAGARRGGLG